MLVEFQFRTQVFGNKMTVRSRRIPVEPVGTKWKAYSTQSNFPRSRCAAQRTVRDVTIGRVCPGNETMFPCSPFVPALDRSERGQHRHQQQCQRLDTVQTMAVAGDHVVLVHERYIDDVDQPVGAFYIGTEHCRPAARLLPLDEVPCEQKECRRELRDAPEKATSQAPTYCCLPPLRESASSPTRRSVGWANHATCCVDHPYWTPDRLRWDDAPAPSETVNAQGDHNKKIIIRVTESSELVALTDLLAVPHKVVEVCCGMFDEPLDPGLVSRHEVREPLVGHVELIVEVVQLAKVVRKTVDVFFED